MRHLIRVFFIGIFLLFNYCSSDEPDELDNTPTIEETFGNWTPDFIDQTSNFTQTRTGSQGTQQTRTINVTAETNTASATEGQINQDINEDGDFLEEIEVITITYTSSENLGSYQTITYTVLQDNTPEMDYSSTGIAIIRINTNNIPIENKDDYVVGTVSIEGRGDLPSLEETEMKIKGRGNSTWWQGGIWGKKPYQIKFGDKTPVLNMPEDKKWVLLAELSDKTFIRNQIARYLGHMSSLEYTPSARYVEVVLNNEHQGLYLIGQKVEESSNRVDIGDDGYLVEIDQFSRIDEDDVYFTSDVYTAINGDNVFNIKEPNLDMDSEEYNLIRNQVEAFETALFSENFSDPETGYAAFVDVDSFIDWYVITEIAKSVDARWYSSIFFTYVPGEKIKMGPLWDFDLSFGNVDYADAQYSEGFWILQNPWIQRMYEDPAFREKVKTRFDYYYSKRSEIMTTIDDYSNQLEKSQELNYQRWPTLGVQVWPNPVWFSTYGEEVEHLKQWITERMNWLNSNL